MLVTQIPSNVHKVLLRCDLNVPLENGVVLDSFRIEQVEKTISYLRKRGHAVLVLSHLAKGSLRLLVSLCESIWKCPVLFADNCLTPPHIKSGEVVLLENVRLHSGEKQNDKDFARSLASLADVYVNDAFSVSHRSHASIDAIVDFLPSYIGFQMMEEINALSHLLDRPSHPFIALVGGSKVSTKLPLLKNLMNKVDLIFVGGSMANTFFASRGYEIGSDFYEKDLVEEARSLDQTGKFILPIDVVIEGEGIIQAEAITERDRIVDIGGETLSVLSNILSDAKIVMWNGPMGWIENPPFDKGTSDLIRLLQSLPDLYIVAGGGETALMLKKMNANVSFLSTGGGAFLAYLEGKTLPGLKNVHLEKIKNIF